MLSSDVLVIGYGSLMSGLGLESFGHLRVRGAARVALLNARRGFGKFSQHGDRFAMVLEADYAHQPHRGAGAGAGRAAERRPGRLAAARAAQRPGASQ